MNKEEGKKSTFSSVARHGKPVIRLERRRYCRRGKGVKVRRVAEGAKGKKAVGRQVV